MGRKGRQSRQTEGKGDEEMSNIELFFALLGVAGLVASVAALVTDRTRRD